MAKPYDAIKYTLQHTSAITNIVPASRTYHALKPKTQTKPNITFFEVGFPRKWHGIESRDFSINPRAVDPEAALDLARAIVDAFNGSLGMGMSGTVNGFDIGRAYLMGGPNPIFEQSDQVYNAPVTVTVVYACDTVS